MNSGKRTSTISYFLPIHHNEFFLFFRFYDVLLNWKLYKNGIVKNRIARLFSLVSIREETSSVTKVISS